MDYINQLGGCLISIFLQNFVHQANLIGREIFIIKGYYRMDILGNLVVIQLHLDLGRRTAALYLELSDLHIVEVTDDLGIGGGILRTLGEEEGHHEYHDDRDTQIDQQAPHLAGIRTFLIVQYISLLLSLPLEGKVSPTTRWR